MGPAMVAFIIVVAVLADYFWLDKDRKRWGWMNNWPKLNKRLFLSGLTSFSKCFCSESLRQVQKSSTSTSMGSNPG
ncbi:hypothetical protein [Bacillus tuaregi]|uniref:hypothetical protein n=1 Tax=Bacillus tuaregi TaxID=1816695 RepID=UPI0008F84865|nr:hypothetical protein [Bacillus tuaregi]